MRRLPLERIPKSSLIRSPRSRSQGLVTAIRCSAHPTAVRFDGDMSDAVERFGRDIRFAGGGGWRGNPYQLGPPGRIGSQLAIFSEHAEQVDLCLFDADGTNEQRVRRPSDRPRWTATAEVRPGQRTGTGSRALRAGVGHRSTRKAALVIWQAHRRRGHLGRLLFATIGGGRRRADAATARHSCRRASSSTRIRVGGDSPLRRRSTARSSTRCMSRASPSAPDVPEELRGTYAGMGSHRRSTT